MKFGSMRPLQNRRLHLLTRDLKSVKFVNLLRTGWRAFQFNMSSFFASNSLLDLYNRKHILWNGWILVRIGEVININALIETNQPICVWLLTSHSSHDSYTRAFVHFVITLLRHELFLVVLLFLWYLAAAVTGQLRTSVAQEQKRKFPASCSFTNAGRFIVGYNKHQSWITGRLFAKEM